MDEKKIVVEGMVEEMINIACEDMFEEFIKHATDRVIRRVAPRFSKRLVEAQTRESK